MSESRSMSLRVSATAKALGLHKTGATWRRPVGLGQGVILAAEERESYGLQGSHWYLALCPASYVDFRVRIGAKPKPFERFSPRDEAAFVVPLPVRADSPHPGEQVYRPDDPADVAAFGDYVQTWLEPTVSAGVRWLTEPGSLLDDYQAEQAVAYDARRIRMVAGREALVLLAASAERWDFAASLVGELEQAATEDPGQARWRPLIAVIRDIYPELRL